MRLLVRPGGPRRSLLPLALGVAVRVGGCGRETDVATPVRETLTGSADATAVAGTTAEAAGVLMGAFRRSGYPVPPEMLVAAEAACRSATVPPGVAPPGDRPVVVADMRGLGVMLLVLADATGATGCRIEADPSGALAAGLFAVADDPSAPLSPGDLTLGAMEYATAGTVQRAIAVGRAGDRAVHVRAGFDDDTYVTASLSGGWYAMWWPGLTKAAVIVAGDNRNEALEALTPP